MVSMMDERGAKKMKGVMGEVLMVFILLLWIVEVGKNREEGVLWTVEVCSPPSF